ncbi:MAG: GTP-sensing pleiotropic transcriptional regulator CodY [Eubacterium sp.]
MKKGDLISEIRALDKMLLRTTDGNVSFAELCSFLYDMLDCNVYVINRRGKVLAARFDEGEEAPLYFDEETKKYVLPDEYNDKLLAIEATIENLRGEKIKEILGSNYKMTSKYHTIVPVIAGDRRIATLVFARSSGEFSTEDIAICEYGSTVVGIEVRRGIAAEEAAEQRQRLTVRKALRTLSYSELEATKHVIGSIEGDEGLLVASKIADQTGITRSVIPNSLRKLESAGIIESRSLGMKGTHIRIINKYLKEELKNFEL